MWIQPNEATLFEISKFTSIFLKHDKETQTKYGLFGWPKTVEVDVWTVKMDFVAPNGQGMTYTFGPNENYDCAVEVAKQIIHQIKQQHPDMINIAFEETVLKE